MVQRDEHEIIVQHPSMDGGDSAARMGISALRNEKDAYAMHLFFTPNAELVRHPCQAEWSDPKKTSRDQLVQFCVSKSHHAASCAYFYKDKWFVNSDILLPDVRLYLYRVAQREPSIFLNFFGQVFLWLSLFWNTKIKPHDELNQFACMCIALGGKWPARLKAWHPDINKNIRDYWGGWRDQSELGEILIQELALK